MEAAAILAVQGLFATCGVRLQPMVGSPAKTPGRALAALGVVRFASPGLSGTATVGASAPILKRSNSGGTSHRDWIAELANQFFGRFKLKLLRGGFELWSMAPVAITGRLLATGVSQPESPPLAFVDAQGDAVLLWIEVEISGEVKVGTPASDGEIPSEGDIILF
jgi:hypothetical protein